MTDEQHRVGTDNLGAFRERGRKFSEECQRARQGYGAFRGMSGILSSTTHLVMDSALYANDDFALAGAGGPWGGPRFFRDYYHPKEFLHYIARELPLRTSLQLLESLASPSSFRPMPMWSVFWALATAENRFLFRYVPFWSHEERLTGHLLSSIDNALEASREDWSNLCTMIGQKLLFELWYSDTAAAKMEKFTGADLGLIVHANLNTGEDLFKVARLQAKKYYRGSGARIDVAQLRTLSAVPQLGYYVFYHESSATDWTPPPTIRNVGDHVFASKLDTAAKDKSPTPAESASFQVSDADAGVDLAAFIAFGLSDAGSNHGVLCSSPENAVRTVMTAAGPMPTRVMVLSIATPGPSPNWQELIEHFQG